MKKLWVIIQREYLSRVKKRSFLLTTILVPVLIFGFYALMGWLMVSNTGSTKQIAVIDESGLFKQKLANNNSIIFSYPNESFDELKKNLDNSEYSGILYIPKIDIFKVNDNIKFYSSERLGPGPKDYIVSELKRRIRKLRMENLNIDNSVLKSLDDIDMSLVEKNLKGEEDSDQTASELLSVMGMLMGFILYFVLLLFGTMVMRGVKEEKTNRIVEVIMSSVKPFQLMLGKIVGISFVGLTQFIIWGLVSYFSYLFLMPIMFSQLNIDPSALETAQQGMDAPDVDQMQKVIVELLNYNYTPLIIAFFFYFLGGYFIYASLFSAVGSIVEDDNESQQFVLPVMMPIILSIIIVSSMMNDPNSKLALWASIFPLTSPIVMPARIPFDPPTWQIVLSAVTLIASTFFFVWLSAKIYRTGILMYGKKVTFKEVFKWLKY